MADCSKESNDAPKEPVPTVTMKFDSSEESDNYANDDAEKLDKDSDNSSSSNSMPNRVPQPEQQNISSASNNGDSKPRGSVLATPKFGNCFGNKSSELSSNSKPKFSLLRPSQLNSVTNPTGSTTKCVLQPAKFRNPFAKSTDVSKDCEVDSENNKEKTDEPTENKKDEKEKDEEVEKEDKEEKEKEKDQDKDKDKDKDKEKEEEKEKGKEKEKEAPKFLALSKSSTKENENSVSNSVNSSIAASSSTQSFVFGQNLKERVAVAHDADSSDNSEKEETKEEPTNENGSSELMFSNAATVCRSTSKPGLTLSQAAQELEEANRASKRKYSEVTLLTGEEDETNVLQINCKLFAFDKSTSSWQERGRGSLRLNDKDDESRLVGRAAGTQRLVLNTKVWPGMTAERAGPKSLRLTAMDVQGDIRIFVVQAAQKEVEQLLTMLLQRVDRAQERQPKKLAADH